MTKRLVSNTGPLIALSGIGELEILNKLFDQVMIPRSVYEELTAGLSAILSDREAFKFAEWIRIVDLPKHPELLLTRMLDAGEASVIQLASEYDATILMDERKGRKIAGDVYGLPVIGTAGLLILAKRAGLINEAVPLLVSMRKNGYWIDEEILDFVMQEANE